MNRLRSRLSTLPASLSLALLLGAALAACHAGGASDGASAETASDGDAAMAAEHAGDRPEATEASVTEPAVEVSGEPVIYAEIDGREVAGYLARPTDHDGPRPGILVIHEWWGLNDNVRSMTRRLAGEGYVALAVDLYGGEVAETPERARELVTAVAEERALENLRQARAHLEERLRATGDLEDRIGVIGWCFGGGWSLRAALAMPEGIDAAVVYYGRPITDRERLSRLEAPLLGIFGAEDRGIPVDRVRELERVLEELGKEAEVHVYEGAGHAFANPSGTRYEPEAARAAWEETVEFLDRHLRRPPGSGPSGGGEPEGAR